MTESELKRKTKAQLQEIADDMGVAVYGTKAQMIAGILAPPPRGEAKAISAIEHEAALIKLETETDASTIDNRAMWVLQNISKHIQGHGFNLTPNEDGFSVEVKGPDINRVFNFTKK